MVNAKERDPLDVQYDNLKTKTDYVTSGTIRTTSSVNLLAKKIQEAETLQAEIQNLLGE
jgi:hypothetical protein